VPKPTAAAGANVAGAASSSSLSNASSGSGHSSGSGRSGSGNSSSLNILIAEDNVINVKVLSKLLTREGHTVAVAKNGKEALDMYNATPHAYQLIFMDLHMYALALRTWSVRG